MQPQRKVVLLLAGVAFFVAVLLVAVVLFSFFSSQDNSVSSLPTPTPVPYQRDKSGKFIFTPFEKTIIGKTTTEEVEKNNKVITKIISGDVTTYTVTSKSPGETDEIKTKNGIVVFESNNLFNKAAGYPPKIDLYQKEFGASDKVVEEVSPLAPLTAYIYAKRGFTLFVNPHTKTVYEIQRYLPTTVDNYERIYPDFLQPAPTSAPEYFK